MEIGLHAGFAGEVLHPALLREIKAQGFSMVRLEVGESGNDPGEYARGAEFEGLRPLLLTTETRHVLATPPRVDLEWWNEPDLLGDADRSWYAASLPVVTELAVRRGVALWIGAVSNLNQRGLAFLRTLPWQKIPPEVGVSIHRYPHGSSWKTPHKGFRSREAEVDTLRTIIGRSRKFGVSEVGYSTGKRGGPWFWPKKRWTLGDVAWNMQQERLFWASQESSFVIGYQINMGSTDHILDGYGFRDLEGRWLPVSRSFTGR